MEAIKDLAETQMTGPAVEGVWTVKDILGHIASWEEACLVPLRNYASSGQFDGRTIADHLAWNDIQSACKQATPLEEVRQEMIAVRKEMVTLLEQLPDSLWGRPVNIPWGNAGR